MLSSATVQLTETDAAADISTAGQLTVSDVDSPQAFVAQSDVAGSYGIFAIDASGAWTYTAGSAHDEFVAGQTYTDSFTVQSVDGTATTVTVNILGTNDAAVLSSATVQLTETDAAADISTAGQLTVSDIDSPQAFVAQSDVAGSYGVFAIDESGAWTYTAGSAHDAFVAGQTYTDSFTVQSVDGTATTVTVNILGTNDAPVVSGPVTSTAVEEGALSTLDALAHASDVDDATTLSVAGLPDALPAGVSYDAATHSFTLDPGNAAYQHLANGETATSRSTTRCQTASPPPRPRCRGPSPATNDAPVVSGDRHRCSSRGRCPRHARCAGQCRRRRHRHHTDGHRRPGRAAGRRQLRRRHATASRSTPANAAYQHLANGQTTTVSVELRGVRRHRPTPATCRGPSPAPTTPRW